LSNDWRSFCRVARKNEGVSTAQLKLFAEMLSTEAPAAPEEIGDANKKLREVSAIDERFPNGVPKSKRTQFRSTFPSGLLQFSERTRFKRVWGAEDGRAGARATAEPGWGGDSRG
jgi:hypothetical protein